jgi:hypothetical protein
VRFETYAATGRVVRVLPRIRPIGVYSDAFKAEDRVGKRRGRLRMGWDSGTPHFSWSIARDSWDGQRAGLIPVPTIVKSVGISDP